MAPVCPRGFLSLAPISELTKRSNSGTAMHAMRIVSIHGSMPGSQSAANRLELSGQRSITPSDWQASIAMCNNAAQNNNRNAVGKSLPSSFCLAPTSPGAGMRLCRMAASGMPGRTAGITIAARMECVNVPCQARNDDGPPKLVTQSMSATQPAKTAPGVASFPARGKNPRAMASDASP